MNNREQRRRQLQRQGINSQAGVVEKPLTTSVGVDLKDGKVVVQYSITLDHMKMPPEEAIKMARHLALAARHINPDLAWPKEAE